MMINKKFIPYISALIWLTVAFFLAKAGFHYLFPNGVLERDSNFQWSLISLVGGIIVGNFKGKLVILRSVTKGLNRISNLPKQVPLYKIFPLSFYLLMLGMMGLGLSLTIVQISPLLRGFIDIAVAVALLKGGFAYLESARSLSLSSSG